MLMYSLKFHESYKVQIISTWTHPLRKVQIMSQTKNQLKTSHENKVLTIIAFCGVSLQLILLFVDLLKTFNKFGKTVLLLLDKDNDYLL
jgi:hypothetical protein